MTFSLSTDTVVMMGVLVAVVLVGNSCACLILTVLEPFFKQQPHSLSLVNRFLSLFGYLWHPLSSVSSLDLLKIQQLHYIVCAVSCAGNSMCKNCLKSASETELLYWICEELLLIWTSFYVLLVMQQVSLWHQ